MPYVNDQLFLPKPFIHVDSKENRGDSSVKKKIKKMKYVQLELLEAFINGEYPMDKALKTDDLVKQQMKTSVAIRGREETEPYRVNSIYFEEGCGLYIITASSDDETASYLEGLLESLSYSGIGGKRSAGFGRFKLCRSPMKQEYQKRIVAKGHIYMALSLSLPKEKELPGVLNGASYQLIKRSGFVASDTYSKEYLRKKDLYVFNSGSCFDYKFQGDVFDVSSGGTHPVYRYAKPMFLGVR
jgi:CRISPR-associated protein Csm4